MRIQVFIAHRRNGYRDELMTTESLPVYTIGHSNRPIDEFVALLTQNGVTRLVDIRTDSVNDGWRNTSFRGFADYMSTDEFKRGLDALLYRAAQATTAIMCAEAVPWRCHRALVADALKAAGCRVFHIVGSGAPSAHKYTPFLRRHHGELTYPASAVTAD